MPPRSATSFCSGSRSITGYGVSGSNSVELAPSMPTTWRANSATAICIPRQMPRNGIRCSRATRAAAILPSIPRPPKPPGMRMPSRRAQALGSLVGVERLGVDPVDLDAAAVLEAGVAQRLDDGQVGVLELHVLADERDAHGLGRLVGARRSAPPTPRGRAPARRCGSARGRSRRRPRRGRRAGPCRCCRRRARRRSPRPAASRTARSSCGCRGESAPSERHMSMSGAMPMRRSSLTECCVGLVFSSPAWPM